MLHVRWLDRVRYRDAHALQRALLEAGDDYLLLLEHPHVYTLGMSSDPAHVLVSPAAVGAEFVATDRGGDVTYHGPGQLVGYPILTLPERPGVGTVDVRAYVRSVEQLVSDALADLGLPGTGRLPGCPGVWLDPAGPDARKIAAVGVRLRRGRTMHGFALNVDPDMSFFQHIVPCGIRDKAVTSLALEGVRVSMREVVDAVARRAADRWGGGTCERQDVAWRSADAEVPIAAQDAPRPGEPRGPVTGVPVAPVRLLGRLSEAGVPLVETIERTARKPEWLRVRVALTPRYHELDEMLRELRLATVCKDAGCPNIFECWGRDGTATFMINGERCTRACGFCLVDTRHPWPPDPEEPARVAEAVQRMGLDHAVVTAVARDDLADGGAAAFAASIAEIRRRSPRTTVEVLIPDCKGDPWALGLVFDAAPDVLDHNVETVPRLQRAARSGATYARSLAVLARAKAAGLTTKSGLMLGMGETDVEVLATLGDLHAVGVDIVTLGQYLRPSARHLPVARWWRPDEFDSLRRAGEAMGIAHIEASPFTRSSYHAKHARDAVAGARSVPVAAEAANGA